MGYGTTEVVYKEGFKEIIKEVEVVKTIQVVVPVEKIVEKIVIQEKIIEPKRSTAIQTVKILSLHRNFKMPSEPRDLTPDDIVKYTTEAIANFISPPKIPNENEEFSCENVAEAVQEYLMPRIIEEVKMMFARREVKRKRQFNFDK